MLLIAMLAMVLAAAVPAFAQPTQNQLAAGGGGDDLIQQCQNNLNQAVVQEAEAANAGNVAVSGDVNATAAATNVNAPLLINDCTQTVNEFNQVFVDRGGDVTLAGFTFFEGVEQTVFFDADQNVFFIVVEGDTIIVQQNVVFFTVDLTTVVTSDVGVVTSDVGVVTADTGVVLPETGGSVLTGGSALLALGAGALLVAGGLLARRIVR